MKLIPNSFEWLRMTIKERIDYIKSKLSNKDTIYLEAYMTPEASIVEGICPMPYGFSCKDCIYNKYCEVIFK